MKILIVEDDDAIAEPLTEGLEREGFSVARAATGTAALATITAGGPAEPDLILLDLGLPDVDGYQVCRHVREQSHVPIIVITARGDEVDRVVGLELGADDYMVKPFGFRELLARIRAVTRRTNRGGAPGPVLRAGPLEVDTRTRQVTLDGETVELTRKEFDLLAMLASDPGALRTRQEILEEVWDPHWYGPTKTLDVHIASLRRKLGRPELIETVRGVGFRLRAGE